MCVYIYTQRNLLWERGGMINDQGKAYSVSGIQANGCPYFLKMKLDSTHIIQNITCRQIQTLNLKGKKLTLIERTLNFGHNK